MKNLNYGIIGNCTSAAMVSWDGSIDWCCLPSFDSSSVFARLIDKHIGGEFKIELSPDYKASQQYLPKTNVLVTAFSNGPDRFELIDFMPRYRNSSGQLHCPPEIIRYIRYISGTPALRVHFNPRPSFGKYSVITELETEFLKKRSSTRFHESVYLYSDLDLVLIENKKTIPITEDHYLLLSYHQKLTDLSLDAIYLKLEKTKVYWLDWSAQSNRFSQYSEEILRSALVLKLLTFQKTGAIIAAVTTSLPEELGGTRNWDYRYCWLRDAGMIIAVMTKLNHYKEARRFLDYILDIIPYKDEKIQIMYGIKGQKNLKEKSLTYLEGYEGSQPVRIGNRAFSQKQNDIFGVLLHVIYQYLSVFKRGTIENRESIWTVVRTLARHVEKHWMLKDRGIWEFRGMKKHFTFSKVLCWVAMDRAAKIALFFGKAEYARIWRSYAEKIKAQILKHGWNPHVGSFTQAYDEEHLDAANLLMEEYGFIRADDPMYISTVKATDICLCRDGLMYRYRNCDDFGEPKSSFTVCTFWLVKSLFRIGERERARELFENLLSLSNHVGLLSEDIDFTTKRLLGNFPQGYSHLSLIDAAITLSGKKLSKGLSL